MQTKEEYGRDWYLDESDGTWIEDRHCCRRCLEAGKVSWADEQYSFGIYAGRWCDTCWPKSGYRDAVDPDAEFDPTYAGERIDEDY